MLNWHIISDKDYKNLPVSEKSFDKLFYVSDTEKIFCGIIRFVEAIVLYRNEPSTNSSEKIYINANTLEGKVWDKNKWVSIINPVKTEFEAIIDEGDIISSYYMQSEKSIYLIMEDNSIECINLSNIFINCIYTIDGEILISGLYGISNKKNYINISRSELITVTVDKDSGILSISFLESISDKLNISIKEIISNQDYTDLQCIPILITGNNFEAECTLYSNDKNKLLEGYDIYAVSDLNKLNAVSTFSLTESSDTEENSTESTINEVTSTLQSSFDKMMKVGAGYTGEIIIADDTGNASPSGAKIGSSEMSDSPSDNLVATEKAIVDYVNNNTIGKDKISQSADLPANEENASDEKIASEKSMIKAMSWKILS